MTIYTGPSGIFSELDSVVVREGYGVSQATNLLDVGTYIAKNNTHSYSPTKQSLRVNMSSYDSVLNEIIYNDNVTLGNTFVFKDEFSESTLDQAWSPRNSSVWLTSLERRLTLYNSTENQYINLQSDNVRNFHLRFDGIKRTGIAFRSTGSIGENFSGYIYYQPTDTLGYLYKINRAGTTTTLASFGLTDRGVTGSVYTNIIAIGNEIYVEPNGASTGILVNDTDFVSGQFGLLARTGSSNPTTVANYFSVESLDHNPVTIKNTLIPHLNSAGITSLYIDRVTGSSSCNTSGASVGTDEVVISSSAIRAHIFNPDRRYLNGFEWSGKIKFSGTTNVGYLAIGDGVGRSGAAPAFFRCAILGLGQQFGSTQLIHRDIFQEDSGVGIFNFNPGDADYRNNRGWGAKYIGNILLPDRYYDIEYIRRLDRCYLILDNKLIMARQEDNSINTFSGASVSTTSLQIPDRKFCLTFVGLSGITSSLYIKDYTMYSTISDTAGINISPQTSAGQFIDSFIERYGFDRRMVGQTMYIFDKNKEIGVGASINGESAGFYDLQTTTNTDGVYSTVVLTAQDNKTYTAVIGDNIGSGINKSIGINDTNVDNSIDAYNRITAYLKYSNKTQSLYMTIPGNPLYEENDIIHITWIPRGIDGDYRVVNINRSYNMQSYTTTLTLVEKA